jgi:hypothetical protein
MKHFQKYFLVILTLCSGMVVKAQRGRELYELIRPLPLNAGFNRSTTSLPRDDDKYSFTSGSYRLADNAKNLYALPVQKVLLIVYDDTVQAASIFLPFDSTLHIRMEDDLGPSMGAWMALEPGVDTTGMILDRRWFLDDYIIVFACTRYIGLRGETTKDDRIMLTVSRKRRKGL